MREAVPATVPDPERPQRADGTRAPIAVLAGAIGNRALARLLADARPQLKPGARDANYGYKPHKDAAEPTRITDAEGGGTVELLQLKLNWHLSAMRRRGLIVDGAFGPATATGVIAFKRARGIRPADATVTPATWAALDQSPIGRAPSGAAAKGPGPEYGKLMADGLLQITLAIGFDEYGLTRGEFHELHRGLTEVRGFAVDPDRAAELYEAAGHAPPAPGGALYVKEDVATSAGTPVHAVVRLIGPAKDGGDGSDSAAAALQALDESEVFEYGGHARYGTGPDFDRNYTIVVHWDKVPAKQRGGRSGDEELDARNFLWTFGVADNRSAIDLFERMRTDEQLTFTAHPGGNLGINPAPITHKDTLGWHLIGLATVGQPLRLDPAVKDDHYRLWLFNGCVTKEYMSALRGSSNTRLDRSHLDVTTNVVPPYVITLAEGLLAYLDGVIAQEGARALVERMENAHPLDDDRYGSDGFEDNPALTRAP